MNWSTVRKRSKKRRKSGNFRPEGCRDLVDRTHHFFSPDGYPRATLIRMMPGGHLATSAALSAVAYGATGSVEVAAGCVAGGFFIDVDHYLDYLLFEKQWRRPSP